jgi:hypothetical protein
MTKEEFWEKWQPTDWPALDCEDKKKEFMADLDKVIKTEKVVISNKSKENREFVEKCLSSISNSMGNCQALLVKQIAKVIDTKTELAIRKSHGALEETIKAMNYYKSELEPESCDECGAEIE